MPKVMVSKEILIRITIVVLVWLTSGALREFGGILYDLKPWMFTTLFATLIPTSLTLAGLIAVLFEKHYQPVKKVKPGEGNKKFFEMRNDFWSLMRKLFAIAIFCVILLPFSEVLGSSYSLATSSFVLIIVILFALFTFYDAFNFIMKSTAVHWKMELSEVLGLVDKVEAEKIKKEK